MDGLELPPVIVEGDWSPAQVRFVRNKLQLHFQSKKRSNGGECRVELEDGALRAAVYFKAAEVRDLVLVKKNHEIVVENQTLKLRLIHPAESNSGKTSVSSDGATPPLSSTGSSVLLMEPITPSLPLDLLCMLVESASGSDESNFSLEVLWESGRAVVTFKNPKDAEQMLSLSTSHPKLLKHGLRVEAVEAADSVRIEGLPPQVSTELLEMYCEKHWTQPLSIKQIPEEEAAIITFSDSKVVESICVKQDHTIRSIPIRIYPYHRSLETALYGAERPQWQLPAPITDKVHHVVWKYLQKKKLSGSINEQMRPHFCSVDLEESEAKLRPLPGLLRQKNVTSQLIEAWTEDVQKAFRHVMSQFSMFECLTNEMAWKAAENDVHTELKDDAVLMLDVPRGVLMVGGRADDMKRLKAPVENIVCKAMDHVERLTNATSEGISLTPDWFFILKQEGLQKAADEISPEMKVSYDEDARILTITGLPAEILNARVWILERQMKMCKKQLSFAPCLLDFLRTVDPMDMYQDLFKSQGITATFRVEGSEVVLVGSSDQALVEAEKKMNLTLSVQTLDVEDQNVLKLKEWGDLNQELIDTLNTAKKRKSVEIQINPERSKVCVAGFMDPVKEVSGFLREFLSDYAHVQECLPLRSLAVTQFIEKKKSQDWISITKDKNVSVHLDQRRPRILLTGPRLHVKETKSWFIDLTDALFTDTLTVDKPGAKKYFDSQGRMLLSTMMTELNCVVLLKSRIQGKEDLDSSVVHSRVKTTGGTVVSVSEANICSFRVDAVVNAANETLQHVGGVAQALLRAAGPDLQKSSNEYVAINGRLWPGTAVVTPAFALPCKYVIHAIGPRFSRDQQRMAVDELKAAVMESLKQADLHRCASVALPAISSGIFGFPIDLCAQIIAQAVQEYCGQSQGWITEVHLVDNNINTVRVLAEAVNREFGGSGAVMAPQQKAGGGGHNASGGLPQISQGSGPSPSRHWVSETNLKETPKPAGIYTERRSFREGKAPGHHVGSVKAAHQTAEGLKVVLCEGNIQDQMTDVIVNTISPNLNLAQGAVSKAILSVAGRGLQDTVRSEVGAGSMPYGSVIVTDGCKLACRKVFRMVCPFWDNQDGQAEEVLVSIVRFCLEEAEKLQMLSLSFPAVGTGNLKFPRDVVSRVLLKEIHTFSQRAAPSYLREVVVVVHPSDGQTVVCFTQDFLRRGGSMDIEWEELEYEEEQEPDEEVISQSQASAPPSLVSSPSLGVYQMKIHQLTLEVSSGDITKDSADVIVNSSNPEFTLRTGVSKAILDGAGPTVMMEISDIVSSPNYQQRGMISTSAGNLPSGNIVHVHVPSEPPMIKDAVYSVLKFCEENNFSSLSFPALGTGAGGAKPSEVADAMVGAVVEFEKKTKPQYVQSVKILIFQTSMISEFHQSMMRKQQDVENQSRSLLQRAGAWFKDTFTDILPKTSNVQKSRTTPILETEEFEPTVFELCAEDSTAVDLAKRRIEDLIVAEQAKRTVSDPFIRLLSQADWDQLSALQRKLTVSFRLEPEQEDQEPKIHLQGLTRDVFTAESEVRDILLRLERADNQRKKAQQLSRTVQWQYVDRFDQMVTFDPPTNLALEEGKQNKNVVNIKINGEKFRADPVKMKAKSEKGRSSVDLLRTDIAGSSVLLMEPITPSLPLDLLCMLVESASGSDESNFSLEVLWESGRAVVTFKNPKDAEQMLSLSTSHPKLLKHGLRVEAVEAADSVRIEGLPPQVSTELLEMYCEKHWTQPLSIKQIPEEEAAIITFSDSKVVESICVKQDHTIRSIPIRIYPYHRSLETALYGAERPQWQLPAPITDKVHHVVWKYLQKKKLSGSINEQMRPHFCSVDLEESEAKLRPLPGLLRQKNVTSQLIEAWTEDVQKAFRHVMSQFSMFECLTNEMAWKAAENDVHTELKDDAVLMLDVPRGVLMVGGRADDMKRLKAPVENIVCKAMDHVERLTNATSEGISLTPDWFFILKQEGLQKAADEISPEMKVSYDEDARILTITGLPAEILNARVWILERQMKMCKKQLSFAPCLLDFLRTVDPMDMYQDLFKSQGITATFRVEGSEVVLVGSSDQALVEAEKKMNLTLSVQTLDVEDQNVLKLKEWGDLNQELIDTLNTAKKRKSVEIQINPERSKVCVAGFMDPVKEVSGFLREFLSDYAHVQECLPLRSLAVTQFIEKKKSQDWISITKDKNVSVHLDQRRPRILLTGPRLHVKETKSWFIDLTDALFTDTLTVDKPGAKKYFDSQGRMLLSTMMTELNCVVLLKSRIQGKEDLDSSVVHSRVKTTGGTVVSVSEANICSFRVDAVVNAANETLQHVGGVAQALLRAAGPDLQKSSNEYVAINGRLWPGTAVVTPAFALPCKYVIHAIGPRFSRDQQRMAVDELKAAVMESLKQADLHRCASVALPAISSGIFGFPIDLCAQIIAQAVQEYCGQSQGWITEVHLVDNNINTVRVLAEAVNREFGGSGAVMAPQQKAGGGGHNASGGLPQISQGSGPSPSRHWVSETNLKETPKPAGIYTERRSFREGKAPGHHVGSVKAAHQTVEGLKVVLCEGNIQDQMTDVIVNTISPNLNLAQGAVSKAILSVAGRGFQDTVRSEVGAGSMPYGSVIVTDGCKLACRKVFRMVCPFWDNQDGQAEEVLVSIVRFCLEEAEKLQMLSLSFPAVGTGNLKFPRDVVSRVLLKEIHTFSQRAAPSYLREVVVVVHPSDGQTVVCFTQDFLRRGGSMDIEWEELEYEEEQEPDEEVISQSQASAPPSLVSSPSLGVYQMKIHQLTLEVSSGDITKDSADVIVNSSNPEFTLRTGVSKAILDGAGPTVMMEISDIVSSPNYQQRGMISTSAGNLPSRNIVHVHMPSEPPMIKDAVYSVLKFCEENNFSSLSFPALGTGAGGAKPSEVADAMVGAVVEFEKKTKPQYVQSVKILIFQTSMISEFHQSMMRKQQDVENQSRSLFQRAGAWFIDTFTDILPKTSNVQKSRTTPILETEEFEPTVFELCAEDSTAVDLAKRRIEDLIVAEQAKRTVSDPFIRLLSQADWDQLSALQRKLTVSFRLEPEQEDQEPKIHLQGLTRDVFTAESEVRDILLRLERADNQRKTAQQLSGTVQWQYMDSNDQMVTFDPPTNLALEEGKQNKNVVNIKINGEKFRADPVKMKAKSEKGRSSVALLRTDIAGSSVLLMEPITPSLPLDLLCMLVESASGSDESNFSLEVLWESSRAVVTFKNPKDAEQMLSLSTSHLKLLRRGLRVEAVEAADSVRIEGLLPQVSTDVLEMYCEKHWTQPLSIKQIPEEEAAIVTFSDSKVVESICMKQDHTIRSIPIRIYPYHRSLETALYGAERPQRQLPAPITKNC